MYWDHATDAFNCYYINFELPYRRSPIGFDTLDLDLDMVIDPQLNWHWKDEDEYQAGIQEGGIQADWVMGIEKAKAEVFDRMRNRTRPLGGSWLNWNPDSSWSPPHLPKGWENVCR